MSFYPFQPLSPFRRLAAAASGAVFGIAASSKHETSGAPATSHSIPAPAGTAVGDLLVVCMVVNNGAASITTPTGFSSVSGSNGLKLFWKTAEAADIATLVFASSTTTLLATVAARITGAHATNAVAVASSGGGDPPNVASPWGTVNAIGITYYTAFISHSSVGTVTVPAGTTLLAESSASPSSTVNAFVNAASTTLTAVAAWNPATYSISGSTTGRQVASVIIRPA